MEYMHMPVEKKIPTVNVVDGVFDTQIGNLLVEGYTGNLS
jgi:hypothetical protein